MNARRIPLVLLIAAVIVQCLVPLKMIHRREAALKRGVVYRFKTRPVDPYDAFRGRYVALGYEQREAPTSLLPDVQRHEKLYATLGRDENDYAVIEALSRRPPKEGDWIPVRCNWHGQDKIHLQLPFDRYYMNENLAPEAERKVREMGRRAGGEELETYTEVRVYRGFPVIDRLIVDGKPIEEHLDAPSDP